MKLLNFGLSILGSLFLITACASAEIIGAEYYSRICIAVDQIVPGNESGSAPTVQSAAFTKDSKPGPGKELAVYADANTEGWLILAAFDKTDNFANGWRPQMISVRGQQETRIPAAPAAWRWPQNSGPFEIYVVFLNMNSEKANTFNVLISSLQNPNSDEKLLDLQAKKLRQELDALKSDQDPAAFHAAEVPAAWGGTLRGPTFPWRQMSQKVRLNSQGQGVLIYPYDRQ